MEGNQAHADQHVRNDGPDLLPDQNSYLLNQNTVFKSFNDLEKEIALYSAKYSMSICKDTRYCNAKQFSNRFPGMQFKECVQSGRFYCNICNKGAKDINKHSFQIRFYYCKKSNGYIVSKDTSNFDCTHKVLNNLREEREIINHESQLTQPELEFFTEFGKCNIDTGSFCNLLSTKFPNRIFDRVFIKSMVSKAKKTAYGDDPNAVNKLVDMGNRFLSAGGKFKMLYSQGFVIDALFLMKVEKFAFQELYSDVIILDSTFSTSVTGLLLIPIVAVDSMGRNVILGYILSSTESAHNIINGLEYLDFNLKGSTLISDEALAFPVVAQHFQMKHILCNYHYLNKVSRLSKLLGDKKERFEQLCRSIILENLKSEDADQNLILLKQEFDNESDTIKRFIQSLNDDKLKIARSFTDKLFSAGSKSNQRSESANWSIKSSGNLHKNSLYDLLQHLETVDIDSKEKTIKSIEQCIRNSQFCSDWVNDKISAQVQEVHSCKLNSGFGLNGEMLVYDTPLNEHYTVIVSVGEHYQPPTCNCRFFTSSYLICKHIVAVLNNMNISPYQEKHLMNRWKLSKHPYFGLALARTKSSAHIDTSIQIKQNRTYDNLGVSDITVPHDELERKRQLIALTQQVCNECASSKSKFTGAVTVLTNLLNESQVSSFVPLIKTKNRDRGRIPRPVNKSPLKHTRKRDNLPVPSENTMSRITKKPKESR